MVRRGIEHDLRNKNFGAGNGNYKKAPIKNQMTKQRGQRILGDCWQWEANGQCSRGDNCSFRQEINMRAKSTQPNPSPSSFMQQNERKASRIRSLRGRSPSDLSRITSKKLAPNHSVKKGTLQNACSTSHKTIIGKSFFTRIARLMNRLAKDSKIMMTKVQ